MERGVDQGSFDRWGGGDPVSPVIISVPHAGREYPPALLAALRVPVTALTGLEDRHVDAVALGARGMETMLVQRRGRAWIDLNRAESERDPRVDDGASSGRFVQPGPRVRSGLGLVPRRVNDAGDLWRGRFADAAIEERITADYRPYHTALQTLLLAARAKFGVAVLLDLHSMPPLPSGEPQVVIGDRFGRSAGARFVIRVEAAVMAAGVSCGRNRPYAGGEIVERHGRPSLGIHAVQIELDRSMYLDGRLDLPGAGLDATVALVRRMIDVLADEAGMVPIAMAAE